MHFLKTAFRDIIQFLSIFKGGTVTPKSYFFLFARKNRMLLPVPALRGGPADPDLGALSELHLPKLCAHVLPQGLSIHQARRKELQGGEEGGGVLPHHQVPAR